MTIPIPTIDDFDTSTVMTTIREVVDYLISMVPQINNGDITDLQTTYTNNVLTVTLVKGDGTTISKNVTIQGGSGTESPYPTDVALSLSGTLLNCDIMLSDNTHITGSQDLATFATYAEVQSIQSDLQEQITGLKLSTDNNNMTLNGDSVQIVKSVSGTVSDGNLKITVNGVQSGDIPLPESSEGIELKVYRPSSQALRLSSVSSSRIGIVMNFSNTINKAYIMSSYPTYYSDCDISDTTILSDNVYSAGIPAAWNINIILPGMGINKLPNGVYFICLVCVNNFNNTSAEVFCEINRTIDTRITVENNTITNVSNPKIYIVGTTTTLSNPVLIISKITKEN